MKINTEIEIKLEVNERILESVELHLETLTSPQDWQFERTYGFFSPTSIQDGIFPRVKVKENSCISGVKIKKQEDNKYFEREEYEFVVKSETNAVAMWKALGFTKVRIFEKLRKKYQLEKVEICLDKLPFGMYIEIEGEKDEIEKAIKKFGLEECPRIAKAYLKIADKLGIRDAIFGDNKLERSLNA